MSERPGGNVEPAPIQCDHCGGTGRVNPRGTSGGQGGTGTLVDQTIDGPIEFILEAADGTETHFPLGCQIEYRMARWMNPDAHPDPDPQGLVDGMSTDPKQTQLLANDMLKHCYAMAINGQRLRPGTHMRTHHTQPATRILVEPAT